MEAALDMAIGSQMPLPTQQDRDHI